MNLRWLLGLLALTALGACADDPPLSPAGPEGLAAAKGGNPGGKPGPDVTYAYTLHDLGADAGITAINDANVMVGGVEDQPAMWFGIDDPDPLLLPDPAGTGIGIWATRLNGTATQVVGGYWASEWVQAGLLWDIDPAAQVVVGTRQLLPLSGYDEVVPFGVNDLGQVVGQAHLSTGIGQAAVIWEPNGSGAMAPRALGHLPGHSASWAQAINNAGHVVGRSGKAFEDSLRAVVWFLEADGTVGPPLDLTADADDSEDNMAVDVTEPVDGTIWISGYSRLAGETRATVWRVDVAQRHVVDRIRSPFGSGGPMNAVLDVAIRWGGAGVWQPLVGVVDTLPSLAPECLSSVADLNGLRTVVGWSASRVKGRGGWSCVTHGVIWTRD